MLLSLAPVLEDRPTVLAIGRGEAMLDAVALALDRHGVQLEVGDPDNAVQSVFVHAPDMVLLVGDAAVEEGRATLEKLAATVATAVIPVAILSDDAGLDHRMQAARFGAVAVVLRSASADAMAKLIADVARELPERKSAAGPTDLGEASLDEVVELFARRLRSGILAVSANGGSERVVLRGDRPVTQAIEELVDRLRPLVTQSETVRWEFQQAPTGKLAELTLDDDQPDGELDVAALFKQRRIVIVEKSPARADDLVVALRERGAHVVVIDGEGTGLAKARAIDPDVILVDVSGVGGWASQAMQLIRGDARLRWAALLVTRGEELWRANTPEPDIARLAAGMQPLVEPDESLMQRVRDTKTPIDVRLETTGPTRLLRAVARAGVTVHATVRHRRATIEVDFAEGLIVGARGEVASETPGGKPSKVDGAAAIAVWLGIASGRVRIERRDAPSVANVMAPVDDAIAAADRETPVMLPSIPPPAGPATIAPPVVSGTGRPSPSGETDARVLVTQLETLLDRLRHTLPPGSLEVPSEAAAALAAATATTAAAAASAPAATKARRDPTGPVAVPPPGRLPGAPGKPGARKATQMGMPVPPGLGAPPAKRIAPPSVSVVAPNPVEPPIEPPALPPAAVPVAPPALPAPPAAAPPVLVAPPPAVVASPPRAFDDEAPTHKRPALAEEPSSGESLGLAALLEPDGRSSGPSSPPGAAPLDHATEPGLAMPAVTPLEATDHIALPPPRPEDDDLVPAPRRRGGGVILVLATVAIALLCVGAAVAWRMGLFAHGEPIATPLPPPTIAVSTVPAPSTAVSAPPTSLGTLPTSAVPTSAVPTSAVPTSEVPPPPTSVVEVEPPPTTTVEAEVEAPAPTTTVEAEVEAPPPPTTVAEDTDVEDAVVEDTGDEDTEDRRHSPRTGDPQWFVDRANFRRAHGDLQAAEADYLHCLRISPNNARAMAGLARLHLARHDARTASTWARRLAEGHSPNAGNYVLLGDTLQASGDSAGARRAWEHALEITPNYRDARRRLGR